MRHLNNLARELPQEERDQWVARVNILKEKLEDEDEIGILLEAVGLLSESLDRRMESAISELQAATKAGKATRESEVEAIATAVSKEVMFPDFSDLRTYLRRLVEQNDKAETINEREDRSLAKAQTLLSDFKTLNGKSFVFWTVFVVAITSGVATGLLTSYLMHTRFFS